MKDYDYKKIEKKWQTIWEKKGVYKTLNNSKKKKYYVLDMFPYPSGVGLHVGHPKGYIGSDIFARLKRMQGFNVLHPMGYDAFGLPAEQYAIEHNINPKQAVEKNVKTFEKQLSLIGLSYDWGRRVNTTDPDFYHWTQWIFLKIYNSWYNKDANKAEPIDKLVKIFEKSGNTKINAVSSDVEKFSASEWKIRTKKEKQDILMKYRLAYEGYSEVNWCPKLGTVLANDEILDTKDGLVSERGNYPVVKKNMRQWFMRITAYADRLLSGLEGLDWSTHIKEIQKNWIGRSEGINITYSIEDLNKTVTVFTTRPDTNFGATFLALAPDGAFVKENLKNFPNQKQVLDYIDEINKKTDIERLAEGRKKTGVFTGLYAINSLNNKKMPMYIADFVLGGVGTGALVGVPGHDMRDFEFAQEMKLEIIRVVIGPDGDNSPITKKEQVQEELGIMVNSGFLDGMDIHKATQKIMDYIEEKKYGERATSYKMRDAIFARQRYWGEPIPLWHDKEGVINELKEKDLPLKLPPVKSYQPTGTGESPLASVSAWAKKGYETNTMPGWAGSSWYFLRYMDPKNKKVFADKKAIKYWRDVDMYVGGAEHATGHLLYSRFWHKFLKDYGLVVTEEPFKTLRNQGMILGSDNRKMSKRWGNVINPDDIVKTYGADTLRLYEMFMGPFAQSVAWSEEAIIGPRRFLERVWKIASKIALPDAFPQSLGSSLRSATPSQKHAGSASALVVSKLLNKTIKKIGEDIEEMHFNTAVSTMMILVNEMDKNKVSVKDFKKFLQILAPFAPHMTEELWGVFGEKKSIHLSEWPKYDKNLIQDEELKIAVQVNGKVKAEIMIKVDDTEEQIKKQTLSNEVVLRYIGEKEVKKVIYVKNRLINIVV